MLKILKVLRKLNYYKFLFVYPRKHNLPCGIEMEK